MTFSNVIGTETSHQKSTLNQFNLHSKSQTKIQQHHPEGGERLHHHKEKGKAAPSQRRTKESGGEKVATPKRKRMGKPHSTKQHHPKGEGMKHHSTLLCRTLPYSEEAEEGCTTALSRLQRIHWPTLTQESFEKTFA